MENSKSSKSSKSSKANSLANIIQVKISTAFGIMHPNFREVMYYTLNLLPDLQKKKTHIEAMALLNTELKKFEDVVCIVLDENEVPSNLEVAKEATLLLTTHNNIYFH